MKFVCISDTHMMHDRVPIPDGDVLIHAGDFSMRGDLVEIAGFNAFLAGLPHKHKVVIAGNHDFLFERGPSLARAALINGIYLQDSEVTIDGVRIYGSPWQPAFMDWAFNLERGPHIKEKWDLIPSGVQILVTHGPPFGYGDEVPQPTGAAERVGCADLLQAVKRLQPAYHVFGHVHEGYGITKDEHTTFINASMCDGAYKPVNPPIVFDYSVKAYARR